MGGKIKTADSPRSSTPCRPLLLTKVLFIINPAAGSSQKRNKIKGILDHLKRFSGYLDVFYTNSSLDATRLVNKKRGEGWSLLLCAGGDGTINEVVNGLLAEENGPLPETLPPIGIIPTGTGNGLVREIGLPLDPMRAYQTILEGKPQAIFPAKVNQRYFILMAGAGFDAFVTDWVESRTGFFRKIPKLLTYFLFGFAAIFKYTYPSLRFEVDGKPYTGSTGIVTKASCVVGPYVFSPKSDLLSPTLTLCLFKSRGFMNHLLLTARFILSGRCGEGIDYIQGKEITIQEGEVRVQADGEGIGKLPARFYLSHRSIRLIYPHKSS
ncbi:MAG: diacylglycerol kinase family protein [Nitrospira sp.]|nr:hypothetical protein [Candidatus Manganitrophaceae bacterium]HIL34903.1 hypothetical protein [Candidatus Manganitrophaceae bacterium]